MIYKHPKKREKQSFRICQRPARATRAPACAEPLSRTCGPQPHTYSLSFVAPLPAPEYIAVCSLQPPLISTRTT